jgi:hypothetical protein
VLACLLDPKARLGWRGGEDIDDSTSVSRASRSAQGVIQLENDVEVLVRAYQLWSSPC